MPHDTPLIATIVAGLGLAFLFGLLAQRLRLPSIAGYLLAGVVIGPFTPGYVADQHLATELAELGVILLMFGVGLHFSLKDLLAVRNIAVPGALGQISAATALGAIFGWMMGWGWGAGLIFGLSLSVASTVVLLRALQERRLVETRRGRIAVGWLIVEDLVMVVALVLIPPLAGMMGGQVAQPEADLVTDMVTGVMAEPARHLGIGPIGITLAITAAKVTAFVALMLIVGRRVIPWVLHYVAHTGSRELFRLAVLAIALGVAFGSAALFDVSFALGAFFAGMVMAGSPLSTQATVETLPLRDAFAVLFFVSVGMLFNPLILLEAPFAVALTVLVIVVAKSIVAYLIVRAFGHPRETALTIAASLAQIGEFSFILVVLGASLDIVPPQAQDLVVAGALISILVNPLLFKALDRWSERQKAQAAAAEAAAAAAAAAQPEGTPAEAAPSGISGPEAATPAPESDAPSPAAPSPDAPSPAAPSPVAKAEKPGPEPEDAEEQPTQLSGHAIVMGYGRVGARVANRLQERGLPVLVVEELSTARAEAMARGLETVAGLGQDRRLLSLVNLPGARWLVLAIPDAIEAGAIIKKALAENPDLQVLGRANTDAEIDHLTAAGASTVVMGEAEIARGMIRAVEETADGVIDLLTGGPALVSAPETAETAGEADDAAPASDAPESDGPESDGPESAAAADGAAPPRA